MDWLYWEKVSEGWASLFPYSPSKVNLNKLVVNVSGINISKLPTVHPLVFLTGSLGGASHTDSPSLSPIAGVGRGVAPVRPSLLYWWTGASPAAPAGLAGVGGAPSKTLL